MNLFHVVGDATSPVKNPAVIAHVCNTTGKWGKGFVLPLGRKFPQAKGDFLSKPSRAINEVSIVDCGNGVHVANMVAQVGTRPRRGQIPLRYSALHVCLDTVQKFAEANGATVHIPRIGAGLAGGDWNVIKSVITATMKVDTYVYTLESEREDWPETKSDGDITNIFDAKGDQ